MTKQNPYRHNLRRPTRKGMPPKNQKKQPNNNWIFWIVLGFIFIMLISQNNTMTGINPPRELSYSEFYAILLENKETGQIQRLELMESTENILKGTLSDGTEFRLHIPQKDEALIDLIKTNVDNFAVVPAQTFWSQMFFSFMPIFIIIFFIWFLSHRGSQMEIKFGHSANHGQK